MLAFKVVFDGPDQRSHDQQRTAKIVKALSDSLQDILPGFEGLVDLNTHESWVREAVQLKKDLLISPEDYKIHFSKAGIPFDPTWMKGVAKDGRPVDARDIDIGSRKVALCLFPAILKREPVPLDEDASIAEALTSHRRFLATPRERRTFDPKSCIAKATVLIM